MSIMNLSFSETVGQENMRASNVPVFNHPFRLVLQSAGGIVVQRHDKSELMISLHKFLEYIVPD